MTTKGNICCTWDVMTGKKIFTMPDAFYKITSATYNLTGTKIVAASEDGIARVYDAYEGRLLVELKGHKK